MATEKHPQDQDIYQPMFFEYDKLSIVELFPKDPFTINPLNDLYARAIRFPVLLRKKINLVNGWSTLQFYGKTRVSGTAWDSLYPSIDRQESGQVIRVTHNVLQQFVEYISLNYPLDAY